MLSFFNEAKLVDVPAVEALEFEPIPAVASLEDNHVVASGEITADMSPRMQAPENLPYSVNPLASGKGNMIGFYMDVMTVTAQAINQFVMLTDVLVKPEDAILVHFNSALFCEEAKTIYAAIAACKAKMKFASAPYTLNTAAFFPVLACDYILSSPYVFSHFDTPSIRGGGNFKDAENGFAFDKGQKLRLLEMVHEAGFLPDEAFEKIVEKQGSYTMYGEEYLRAIRAFNKRNKQ